MEFTMIRIFLFAIFACLATGCNSNRPFAGRTLISSEDIDKLNSHYADITAVKARIDSITDAGNRLVERNKAIDDLLIIADHSHDLFKHQVFADQAVFNSIVDMVSIGLSAAATLKTGNTAQILSGTDTALKAAQGKLNERILAQKTISALLNAMDAKRAEVRARIEGNRSLDYSKYPIGMAIAEMSEYFAASSLVEAILRLESDSGTDKAVKEGILYNHRAGPLGLPKRELPKIQ